MKDMKLRFSGAVLPGGSFISYGFPHRRNWRTTVSVTEFPPSCGRKNITSCEFYGIRIEKGKETATLANHICINPKQNKSINTLSIYLTPIQ